MNMKKYNYKIRICVICGKEFKPMSPTQKYCFECGIIVKKERDEQYHKRYLKYFEYFKQYHSEHSEHRNQYSRQYMKQYRQTLNGKVSHRKNDCKRDRNLGFIPLNSYKEGYVFHHLDKSYGIYIPVDIHVSIWHSVSKDINMDEINAVAFNYI